MAKKAVESINKEEGSKFIMLEATEIQNAKLREEHKKKIEAKQQQQKIVVPAKKKKKLAKKGMYNILDDPEFDIDLTNDA